MFDLQRWQANLAALAGEYPELAEQLAGLIAEAKALAERGPEPFDQSFFDEQLRAAKGKSHWLLGCDRNEALSAALAQAESRIPLVCEGLPSLLRLVTFAGVAEAIKQGQVELLVLGTNDKEQFLRIRAALAKRFATPHALIAGSSSWQAIMRGGLGDNETVVTPLLFESICPSAFNDGPITRLRRIRNAYRRRKTLGEVDAPKILSFVADDTQVLEAIVDRYHRGFNEAGPECVKVTIEAQAVSPHFYLREIEKHLPDMLFLPVLWHEVILGPISWFLSLPTITLFNNPMATLTRVGHRHDFPPRRANLLYSWDEETAQWCQEDLGAEVAVQSIATTYENFEDLPASGDEREPAIAFNGSIHEEVDGEVTGLKESEWRKLEAAFWQSCDNKGMGSIEEFIARVDALGMKFKTHPQHVWASVYRISVIEALNGLPLVIYGGANWPSILVRRGIQADYRGFLEQSQALPRVMSRMLINLNICTAHTSAANMRTYDAAGLGSCVLQDAKPEATEHFVEDTEMVFFRSLRDLRAKAEALLADPARCIAIGAAARQKVLAQHTYRARAAGFLGDAKDSLGGLKASVDLSPIQG
ncbi:MAG: glycosyltransferase family 1 protein [Planctomycetes bacterium]|nr:glycosyltransferase family 1 protein [Planctomycetota bacterium]